MRELTDDHRAAHEPHYDRRGWTFAPRMIGSELAGIDVDCHDGRHFAYGFNPEETVDHLLGRMVQEIDIVTQMDALQRAGKLDEATKKQHVDRLMALSRGED